MNTKEATESERFSSNSENTNKQNSNYKGLELVSESEDRTMWYVTTTPFTLIREGQFYYVLMGKYRITKEIKTIEEAKKQALKIDWNKIVTIMSIMIKEEDNIKNLQTN